MCVNLCEFVVAQAVKEAESVTYVSQSAMLVDRANALCVVKSWPSSNVIRGLGLFVAQSSPSSDERRREQAAE